MIHTYARRIVAMLQSRDPLSERVHLSKGQFALYGLTAVMLNALRRIGRVAPASQTSGRTGLTTWPVAEAHDSAAQRASGSSFYTAMRIMPRAQRDAMFEVYAFCRKVDDIADSPGPRDQRLDQLKLWRQDIDALYQGSAVSRAKSLVVPIRTFGLKREDFHAIIDGMEMDVVDDIRAPAWVKLDAYCDRVASAVGRLSVRIFGMEEKPGISLAHHLGRALQLTNILRDIDEDAEIGRLYLPREELHANGITDDGPRGGDSRIRGCRRSATPSSHGRASISPRPTRSWRRRDAAPCARRASCRRPTGRSWRRLRSAASRRRARPSR